MNNVKVLYKGIAKYCGSEKETKFKPGRTYHVVVLQCKKFVWVDTCSHASSYANVEEAYRNWVPVKSLLTTHSK